MMIFFLFYVFNLWHIPLFNDTYRLQSLILVANIWTHCFYLGTVKKPNNEQTVKLKKMFT